MNSAWQRAEVERQLVEQEAAAVLEHQRRREAKRRREEKASVPVRLFDAADWDDAGKVVRRDEVPFDAHFVCREKITPPGNKNTWQHGWIWTWESQLPACLNVLYICF